MRCKNCDYPLWNLKTRQCPECGTAFLPSEFDFVINSVQFCCPHCEQPYYGTSQKGHLTPEEFQCVQCSRRISMNEMVLRPGEGVSEERTLQARMPWLERIGRTWFRSWFSTIWMAMCTPQTLSRATPVHSSVVDAWWFAFVTTIMIFAVAVLPFAALALVGPIMAGTRVNWNDALTAIASVGLGLVAGALITLFMILLWGAVAHGLLRLMGNVSAGIGRTYQALCYSSGANAITAIPCVGMYGGWIWWVVSAVLMMKEGQKVHGGRAAFAVITFPIVLLVLVVGGYIGVIFAAISFSTTAATGMVGTPRRDTTTMTQALLDHASMNSGRWPAHAVELLETASLDGFDFTSSFTGTTPDGVPAGMTNLGAFELFSDEERQIAMQSAIRSLPQDTIAHRLGDFVFTYHGIDPSNADPELWIVILSADPDVGWQTASPTSAAGTVGNRIRVFRSPEDFAVKLQRQNRLRASVGLPALPHPAEVKHDQPATGTSSE